VRSDGGRLFQMPGQQTANACCPKSVRLRRMMALRVDAECKGRRWGSNMQKAMRLSTYDGHH